MEESLTPIASASEVDVNILGHIFENSLTEIEEITNQLQEGAEPTISKRKKDGVFYTPQYITKYIVENTVGKLCSNKKEELGIVEEEYFSDKNYTSISLTTYDFQAPKFYEKCGFKLEFVRENKKNPKLTKYFFVKYF